MQRLCVDYVGPWPKATGGYQYILTVLDTFSRWMEAFPTVDATAQSALDVLTKEVFCRYGIPERIHSDRGRHFTADMCQQLSKDLKIQWVYGGAYNPKSNTVESHHRVLNRLIGKLTEGHPKKWIEAIPLALFIHRTSVNRSTGQPPYSILFGREPTTSLDLLFRIPSEELDKQKESPQSMRERIQKAYQWARENISKAVRRARRGYTGKRPQFKMGDRVWLFTPTIKAGFSKKTNTYWSGPWKVEKEINPLFFEISPHPTWLRNKNETVTIDRLKHYRCHEDDDSGRHSIVPPKDVELHAPGDEFMEHFETGEDDDESTDLPAVIPIVPAAVQQAPNPAPVNPLPPSPPPAPVDLTHPEPNTPATSSTPASAPQPKWVKRLLDDAKNHMTEDDPDDGTRWTRTRKKVTRESTPDVEPSGFRDPLDSNDESGADPLDSASSDKY